MPMHRPLAVSALALALAATIAPARAADPTTAELLARIAALEQEIALREKTLKAKENGKKQVPLRLSPTLWDEIAAWAEEDFRSVNGQIEYTLSDAVRRRKKG